MVYACSGRFGLVYVCIIQYCVALRWWGWATSTVTMMLGDVVAAQEQQAQGADALVRCDGCWVGLQLSVRCTSRAAWRRGTVHRTVDCPIWICFVLVLEADETRLEKG